MRKNLSSALAVLALAALTSLPAFAEPGIDQVWQTANSGHVADAEAMMRGVLAAHPASAKAHFVEAELLARENRLPDARSELARAQQLSPGLGFAKAQAVANLEGRLGLQQTRFTQTGTGWPGVQAAAPRTSFPWNIVLVLGGVLAFMLWATRFMTRRADPAAASPATAAPTPYAAPPAPYSPAPYATGPYAPAPAPASNMGSGMLGGLATGAAVGAGMVAGEALMHRVLGGGQSATQVVQTPAASLPGVGAAASGVSLTDALSPSPWPDDMGGQDFGLIDTGSWDDGNNSSDWT